MSEAGMVIVGGGMAGARAIVSLRSHGWTGAITLVSEETLLPYDRPPLSKAKAMLTEEQEPQPALLLDESMIASLGAILVRGARAVGIDRKARAVVLADGRAISYDKLLIATGAKPRQLRIEGGELAYTLRDFADGDHLRRQLRASRRVAIIGGGFIGLEVASSARKLGCEVSLIEAQPRILMRGVPEEIAQVVHARHSKAGVKMEVGTALKASKPTALCWPMTARLKPTSSSPASAPARNSIAQQAELDVENGLRCS